MASLQIYKWLAVGCWLLVGCTAVTQITPTPILITPSPHPLITPSLVPSPPSPANTPTPPPDSGWLTVQPGLEWRTIRLFNADGRQTEELSIVRLDPAYYAFKVAYQPGEPKTLPEWQTETGALLVVNGGFFTETFQATGLTVIDGQHRGSSYGDFAGMFAVTDAGPEVRWLAERPYEFNEPLQYALQSFPMLVKPGGVAGYPTEDGDQSRRTVVGQDSEGRILFIVAPWGSFTLHELGVWLAESDLNLDKALNLDGGTSTGLLLADPEVTIPAFTRLPIVITAAAK